MLTRIRKLPEGVIGVRASGIVSSGDYEKVLSPILARVSKTGRKVNFLFHLSPKVEGFTPGAAWQDLIVGIRHFGVFNRAAIVTDSYWMSKASELTAPLMPMTIKVFSEVDYDAAIDWLAAPVKTHLKYKLLKGKGIVFLELGEPIERSDLDALASDVDPWIKEHGGLKGLVIHAKKFPGWRDLGSIIRNLEFLRNHHKSIGKVALAADGAIADFLPSLAEYFISAKLKKFDYQDIARATSWAGQ